MMPLPEVHLVGASRAEALRLAPVAIAMREQGRLTPILLAAGPDPAAVDRVFGAFGLTPMITLPTGDEPAEALRRFDSLWAGRTPAAVLVRDTLAGALAAFWRRIPIMQIDAGRRTGDLASVTTDPGQRLLAQLATVHLAATPLTAMNLLDERITAGDVLLTGSTVADAAQLLVGSRRVAGTRARRPILIALDPARTESIGAALRPLTTRFADLEVVPANDLPSGPERLRQLAETYLVVTDDEELAEEALATGVPVLVPGDVVGHIESMHAGSARPAGPEPALIAAEVAELMEGRVRRDAMAAGGNPYGDGLAAYRVAQATAALLGHGQFPDPMPARPTAGVSR